MWGFVWHNNENVWFKMTYLKVWSLNCHNNKFFFFFVGVGGGGLDFPQYPIRKVRHGPIYHIYRKLGRSFIYTNIWVSVISINLEGGCFNLLFF